MDILGCDPRRREHRVTDSREQADVKPDAVSPVAVLTAVEELARASEQAALVRLGLSSGLLARCAEPVTVTGLAAAVNAPEAPVTAVCTALEALGALQREGTRVRLSADWAPLAQGGLDVQLEQALTGAAVRQRVIEEALSQPRSYWERDSTQRRALAEAVTLMPTTEFGRAVIGGLIAGIPGLDELLQSGARWLELGCGVGGNVISTAFLYPRVHAVGVDIAPDVLDVAWVRGQQLGISDRLRFVEGDARAYADDEPFDIVFWSQFFFPRDTRTATLENAFARLRPGGMLLCPVLPGDGGSPEADSPEAQRASLNAIVFGQWDIPLLSGDELAKEITAVGFTDARENRLGFANVMAAFRPGGTSGI